MSTLSERLTPRTRFAAAIGAAALLVVGAGAGALVVHETRPTVTMAPATPIAIRALASGGIATVRGRVAEIFGNKFIVQDATGRALVDAGQEGEGGDLVAVGQTVTVQGRFERGFMHAAFLVRPNGSVVALAPPRPAGHGRHGPGHGPDGDGPDARGPATVPAGAAPPAP